MSKPVWTWTHTGEQGEELCCLESKYYTKFAWDHFLAAYTGKVRPAHRDRPYSDSAHNATGQPAYAWNNKYAKLYYGQGVKRPDISDPDFFSDGADLWPADEKTDPMPQPVISPRQLTPAQKLKSKP